MEIKIKLLKKFREDFVTNSSSSSFVVFYNQDIDIPDQLKDVLHKTNSTNDIDDILNLIDERYDEPYYVLSDKILEEKYHLTKEQIRLVKAARIDQEKTYDILVDILSKKDGYLYYGLYDWNDNSFYYNPVFEEIRKKGKQIYFE